MEKNSLRSRKQKPPMKCTPSPDTGELESLFSQLDADDDGLTLFPS